MRALIPLTRIPRVLEGAVVDGHLKHAVYARERERLVAARVEVEVKPEPVVYLPRRPLLVRHLLEHLLNYGCTKRVDRNPAFLVHELLVEVPKRCHARPESHLDPRPEATLHVDASVVVFELRLRAEDHEEELLIRVVPELLPERAYLLQPPRVHEVYDAPEITDVSRNTIRCPGEDAVVFAAPDFLDDLVEHRPLSGLFSRVALALHGHDLKSLALGELEHLLNLAVYGENLPFLGLAAFSCIQTVPDPYGDCRLRRSP